MIKTGSVLEKLQREVDKQRGRVKRAEERLSDLREEYKTAHWSSQRDVANRGFTAKRTLERAQVDLNAAELALKAEELRLGLPDSFLRFG